MDFGAVDQLADVAPVLEQVIEPSLRETCSPNHLSSTKAPGLGLEAAPVKLLQQGADRPQLQILLKYPPDRLGLVRHNDQLLVLVGVANGD
jgi:hypothetical protein